MNEQLPTRLSVLLHLFWIFFRIGPSTFGGGYAMIPIIEREISLKRNWIDQQQLSDLMSMAAAAPGGVGVNASAFIGYRIGKVPGAIVATLAITLPTFIIVFLLSALYAAFQHEPKVQAAFQGIHAAIIGLMAVAAYKMGKQALFDRTTIAVAACTVGIMLITGINPTVMIAVGLALGICLIRLKKALGLSVQTERTTPDNQPIIEYYI
ncbi:chromate transporter [Paenibacillus phyllosphaerae]|uniref:Chromate transporter n=1 Tax=Paenibacillus phyllosphaerae TaxID=274593 RepID=A0A7W5FNB6_9BACL|nr:chromate transporter [Paenibacillus phyllosphaerae]MBB3111013.1 chromate transporter [Paenibacillus phyllosphaerae]